MSHLLANLPLADEEDVARLREICGGLGKQMQLNDFDRTRLTTGLMELGRNVVEHGGGGQVRLSFEAKSGFVRLNAVVTDQGQGIADADAILSGAAPANSIGLGLGLRGVKQMAAAFDLRTGPEGTQVSVAFASRLPGSRLEPATDSAREYIEQRQAAPELQGERIRDLERELAERDLMIGEVHHRTANNLSLVSALVAASQRKAVNPETRELLAELGLKIAAIGRAHQFFQRNAADEVDGLDYFRDIAQQAAAAFNHSDLAVAIDVGGDRVLLNGRMAIDFGLVLGELITNAFKHAFRGRSKGAIRVRLERHSPDIVFSVCDDGPGLPEGERPERSGSLGWRMIRSVVSRYAGALKIEMAQGLRVTITIPTG